MAHLEVPIGVKEEVLRLEIAVDDVLVMEVPVTDITDITDITDVTDVTRAVRGEPRGMWCDVGDMGR